MVTRNCAPVDNLPAYIIERDRQALAAGLRIESRSLCVRQRNRVQTRYCGTEQQWRASPFCTRTKPFVAGYASSMESGFSCFALLPDFDCGDLAFRVSRVSDTEFRGTVADVLPERTEDLGDGITAYHLSSNLNGLVVVYVGSLDALTARNIGSSDGNRLNVLRDGTAAVMKMIEPKQPPKAAPAPRDESEAAVTSKVNRMLATAARSTFKTADPSTATTPAQWLDAYACCVVESLSLAGALFTNGIGKDGRTFIVAPESHAAIMDALARTVAQIKKANVRMLVPDHEPAQSADDLFAAVASARGDDAFRAFLSRSGVPTTDAARQ